MDICIYGPPLAPPVEYARWTLDRMGVPYRFERAAAGLSAFRSWRLGVPIELPLLTVDGKPHGGFRTAYEQMHGPIAAIAPRPEPMLNSAFVDDLMTHAFGPSVRSFYRVMLQHPGLLKPIATAGMPLSHRLFIDNLFSIWRWMMTGGLNLKRTFATSDLASIGGAFERVASRLNGGAFLGGDTPGGEDILFSVIASPIILPPDHPEPLPLVDHLPNPLRDQVRAFREMAAGQLVMRVYASRSSYLKHRSGTLACGNPDGSG